MTAGAIALGYAAVTALVAVGGYLIWDRHRYRGAVKGQFRPTAEVFRDPSTGRLTRVYEDPHTGARQYREEQAPPRKGQG